MKDEQGAIAKRGNVKQNYWLGDIIMKIKNIELINSKIFGDFLFDFIDHKGNVVDNILIAGENGVGKSTLLNIIFKS